MLSTQTSIQQNYQISRSYTEDITNLEVAFSPQDQVNDDIIGQLGNFNIEYFSCQIPVAAITCIQKI